MYMGWDINGLADVYHNDNFIGLFIDIPNDVNPQNNIFKRIKPIECGIKTLFFIYFPFILSQILIYPKLSHIKKNITFCQKFLNKYFV